MVPINEYKTLDIKLDKVNSYIPPIVVNEADNNGRHLKFTPTYEGQPVTGITSARMYYDPRPRDASSIGDYVDGTKDGDGWVFILPPNTFTANVQGIASVSFTDADGETYTRSMPIYVESGGTKADSQGTRIDRLIATLEQMVNDFTMTADTETGPAGSQASVNVTRLSNGSYNLDFTIPTGAKGPKGDPGDLTTVAHDGTLTGDGTGGNVLRQAERSCLSPGKASSLGEMTELGFYEVVYDSTDVPVKDHRGTLFVSRLFNSNTAGQLVFSTFDSGTLRPRIFARAANAVDVEDSGQWSDWVEFVKTDDLSNYVPLSTYQALEAKVQALEAKTKVTQITADGTDLHTLFGKTGTYVKMWGTSVVNSPTAEFDSANSQYAITVVSVRSEGYMRIDSMAGTMDYSYYCAKNNSGITKWYKIQATPVS